MGENWEARTPRCTYQLIIIIKSYVNFEAVSNLPKCSGDVTTVILSSAV